MSKQLHLAVYLQDVESLGKKLGFTSDNGNFHNVSLGQGQEVVAEEAMDISASNGHWVVLQVTLSYKIFLRKTNFQIWFYWVSKKYLLTYGKPKNASFACVDVFDWDKNQTLLIKFGSLCPWAKNLGQVC